MPEIQEHEPDDKSTYDLDAAPGEPDDDVNMVPLDEEAIEPPTESARAVVQPLPRLWKAEPDPTGEPSAESARPVKKVAKGGEDKPAAKAAPKPKAKANAPKPKPKRPPIDDGDGTEKRVLIEETPALDTYEARQRARLIVGGLGTLCVLICGNVGYRIFLGGSTSEVEPLARDASVVEHRPGRPRSRSSTRRGTCSAGPRSSPRKDGSIRRWGC